MRRWLVLSVVMTAIAAPSCSRATSTKRSSPPAPSSSAPAALRLTSSAFADGQPIPREYSCDGANQPPPLAWTGVPPDTPALALVVEDPDAPRGTFTHWVVYGLPGDVTSLPSSRAGVEATNDAGKVGYQGPCPPPGKAHRYVFTLYALHGKVDVTPGEPQASVRDAIKASGIAAEGRLVGTYQR